MTSLPERLSVVRPHWEAQLDAFHALTTRALDSAEQLFTLNLKTSRASVEQATGTLHQMLHATTPRDLFAIGNQAQGQWQQVFSYSRELLGIAMGARQHNWSTIPVSMPVPMPFQPAPLLAAPPAQVVEQAGIAIAVATTVTTEMATAAAESNAALAEDTMGVGDQSSSAPAGAPTELDAEKTGEAPSEVPAGEPAAGEPADSEPVTEAPESAAPPPASHASALDEETSANIDALVDIVIADAVPPAEPKPLVEALNEVLPKPASAEHPIASTVPLEAADHIELPPVAPLDTTPPVQLSNGPAPERRRSSRKKS